MPHTARILLCATLLLAACHMSPGLTDQGFTLTHRY
jgi:hypothetical protein